MQLVLFHRAQYQAGAGIAFCAVLTVGAPFQGLAQEPVPGPSPSTSPTPAPGSPVVPYRTPVIALVQPPNGGTVPLDKPVVMFRFAQGEPGDPLDIRPFAVAVDGEDRTPLFQVTAGEAWGPLGASATSEPLPAGAHHLAARICSSRGACGGVTATVTAVPATVGQSTSDGDTPRKKKLIDLLIDLGRKLMRP